MTIKIYFDEDKKCMQVLNPTQPLDKGAKIKDIVGTITRGNYYSYSVS